MRVSSLVAITFLVVSASFAEGSLETQLLAVVEIRAKTSRGISTGTGFIVQSDGVVATCHHVIHGASHVAVRVPSGEIFEDIRILAADEKRDLALIKFAGFKMKSIPLADSDMTVPPTLVQS